MAGKVAFSRPCNTKMASPAFGFFVFYFSFGDSFEVLAIGRFSIGLRALHELFTGYPAVNISDFLWCGDSVFFYEVDGDPSQLSNAFFTD